MSLCLCGCGQKTKERRYFIHGHNNKLNISKKLPYPSIPSLCLCGCNEIVYNGKQWILGHHVRINHPLRGKHPSEETRRKQSESHTGLKHSIETIEKMKRNHSDVSGENNPMYGVPSPMKGMFGELNHQYIDGRSFLPYCPKFNNELKESVRIRDKHTCQLCGNIQNNRKHDVHHIHYDKENCYPDLICLCMKCNRKVNFNREHYTLLFINNLNDRGLLFWNIYEK